MQFLVIVVIFVIILTAFKLQNRIVLLPITQEISPQIKTEDSAQIASGIFQANGIAVAKDAIYISTDTEGLLSFKNGEIKQIAPLTDGRLIFVDNDGSLIVPVFAKDKVTKIGKDGTFFDFPIVFSGPTGITKDNRGNFYVTNRTSGSVTTFRQDGKNAKVLINNLENPSGIFYNTGDNTLYIAHSTLGAITTYRLDTRERADILFAGLENIESISIVSNQILATATTNNKSVVVNLNQKKGSFKIIQEVNLPSPIIGYFTGNNEVYLVSPKDTEGKILKIRLP